MKFKRTLVTEQGLRQLDIVPFINIFFLLLVFFMLTSMFGSIPGINIQLPKTISSETFNSQTLTIVISSDNTMYIDDIPLDFKKVQNYIRKKKYRSVFIKADKNASLGSLTALWDTCKNRGIEKIGIVTTHE
jgi:biopolymer transport protein ExbD